MEYGELGENILVDFPLQKLHLGDRLQISEVVLEITQNCTLCDHLSSIDIDLPIILEHDRGIFARVIEGGSICLEDKIYCIGNING